MHNFDANFVVETNTSDMVAIAVLIQHDWPVAFTFKVINSAQWNYHAMDHELLEIVLLCKR